MGVESKEKNRVMHNLNWLVKMRHSNVDNYPKYQRKIRLVFQTEKNVKNEDLF